MWFSIVDYRKTTRLFKDEEWDGPPIAQTEEEFEEITEEKEQRLIQKAQEKRRKQIEEPIIEKPKEERTVEVYHIEGTKVEVMWESVLIFDQSIDGNRLISYQDYTGEQVRRIVNDEQTQLYKIWTEPEKRQHFVAELQKRGITFEHLKEISKLDKVDAFDMLLHFAFNADTKTRQARVNSVKSKPFFEKYPDKAKELLEVILDHYAEVGYQELEGREILTLDKFKPFGGPLNILTKVFSNGEEYDGMINEITRELYAEY